MVLTFSAAIPPTSSAIKIAGGAGEAVTLSLHCYVGDQINELAAMRGNELRVVIGTVQEMARFIDVIQHDQSA